MKVKEEKGVKEAGIKVKENGASPIRRGGEILRKEKIRGKHNENKTRKNREENYHN